MRGRHRGKKRHTNPGESITNSQRSPFDYKAKKLTNSQRPPFDDKAKKLMQKGTDLAHKVSYKEITNIVSSRENGELSNEAFIRIMIGIDPELKTPAEDFIQGRISNKDFLNIANSAPGNLRPGNPSTNRAIGSRLDPNTNLSDQQPFRREGSGNRSRSPSPFSREAIVVQLFDGRHVDLYVKNNKVQSSASKPILFEDLKESLEDSLCKKTSRMEKLTTDKKGNTFRISLSRR